MDHKDVPLKEILSLAERLIAIPSISGDSEKSLEILEFVKTRLDNYNFTPFVSHGIPSLLYTNHETTNKQFTIILNAHLDVVPGLASQFKPYIKDGNLYGRGAYDMKATAAVNIILFNELAKKLPYTIGLQLTTDEEIGGVNGTEHQIQQGVRADFVITGESGSNFRIIHEAKGMLHLKLLSKGKASHSAYPWLGQNAIIQMYNAIDAIHQSYPLLYKEAYQTSVTILSIHSPHSPGHTVTPKYCEALLDVRYLPEEKDTILKKLTSLLPDEITYEVVLHTPPHVTDNTNSYITSLQKIGKDILKNDLLLSKQHATSDARYYTGVNCEGIEFGPIGTNQHTNDEYVQIQSLTDYYRILKTFLLSI